MTRTTTPEVLEPNFLQAYTGFDFSEIIVGGSPNGQNCLRLNHAANSERQNLWQPNRTEFLQAVSPAEPSLSFWINRRQAFAGNTTGWINNTVVSTVVPGTSGGILFGVANAVESSLAPANPHCWSVWGTNTDDLWFAFQYRQSSVNTRWVTMKIADLPLNQWAHVVINRGAQIPSTVPPAGRLIEIFVNGKPTNGFNPTYSASSGGQYPVGFTAPGTFGNMPTTRFSIGDPTFGNTALRGVGNGPLADLAQISFQSGRLTQAQCFALWEAMTFGG